MINVDGKDNLLIRDKNNFNLLRLVAATGVIITHSYALLGFPEKDILTKMTNGLLSFSRLGVYIFFVVSGFLIANSLWHSKTIRSFFWKRFLRIFPALIVVLSLTVFVIAPILTTSNIKDYFLQPGTYHYLVGGTILYDIQYQLSGVFETNPRSGINGSLWTLPYEWTCYVLLAILLIPLRKKKKEKLLFIIFGLIALRVLVGRYQVFQVIDFLNLDMRQLLLFSVFFFSGALALELRKYLKFKYLNFILLFILLCGVSFINKKIAFYLMLFVIPYLTLMLANLPLPKKIMGYFSNFDYSYGLYIYAFLVGQIIVNYFYNYLNVFSLAILTFVFTLPFAMLSWYFVEKPFLRLKKWSLFKKNPPIPPAI